MATLLELERIDAAAREQRLRGELDRSRAGFLTAVTHDLRTPLATIKAASAALLAADSRLDATDRRELLEDTYAEAARLEGLVNKVLEVTRIRTGALRTGARDRRPGRHGQHRGGSSGADAAARGRSTSTSTPSCPPCASTRS